MLLARFNFDLHGSLCGYKNWLIRQNREFMNCNAPGVFARSDQGGFTLIELLVALAIISGLAVMAMPYVRTFMIIGRADAVAQDITRVAIKIKSNAQGISPVSYTALGTGAVGTASFAKAAKGLSTALMVSGSGASATVAHDIGASNSQVSASMVTLVTADDGFAITLPTVSRIACPELAARFKVSADLISVNGVTVKPLGGNYSMTAAQNSCVDGDANTFVFTFR